MSAKEARNTIKELVQYEEKEWDDPVFPNRGSLNLGNSNMEQLLVKMEYQVDSLMKDAISLMGKSENLCGIMSNEVGGEIGTKLDLQNAMMVREKHRLLDFWRPLGMMHYLSTQDHLEPHLQIDLFPGRETDYPPFGYTEPLPHGYDYRYGTSPDGSS
ncbi:hypothetical protein Tco_1134341 [Tanacetum coccineum]